MKRITDCDADTMYMILSDIGINMRELDKKDPSVNYLRELYGFLLYSQLLAWKEGRSPRQAVREVNRKITGSNPIPKPFE